MNIGERLRRFDRLARTNARLSDVEWLTLMRDHRWAIGQLARDRLDPSLRSHLNATVLVVHPRLHPRDRSQAVRLAQAFRRVTRPFIAAWLVFAGAGVLATGAVLAEPTAVYGLVPREMLAQITEHAWGQRGSARADAGMALFYSANNSRACLLALGLGALGGVPGYAVLAYNGALLGAVTAHAVHLGLLGDLLAWLGPHGVPELTAIMLSGAIGWVLATGWMQPGTLGRSQQLARRSREMAPLIGIAIVLVLVAAPLEGFVSPLPLPLWIDGLIALAWIALLVFLTGWISLTQEREAAGPAAKA